jgi:hypothetical protein
MKLKLVLLSVLFLSLVLQNTCPYGFEAKTAFAAARAPDCPHSGSHHAPDKDQDSGSDNPGVPLYPAFVLSIPVNQTIVLCSQIEAEYTPLSSDHYKDFHKEPSTKPPLA